MINVTSTGYEAMYYYIINMYEVSFNDIGKAFTKQLMNVLFENLRHENHSIINTGMLNCFCILYSSAGKFGLL